MLFRPVIFVQDLIYWELITLNAPQMTTANTINSAPLFKTSFPHAALGSHHTSSDACPLASKKTRHASVQSLVSQQPAAPPLLRDLPQTSTLCCSDPIAPNRLHTDIKNIALWENASLQSAVHLCILITGCGLEENRFNTRTICDVATQQVFFPRSPLAPLAHLSLCLSFGWRHYVCVSDVLRKIKDLLDYVLATDERL